ncbi:MAG: universal stress protein [Chloroflexi bacterium]|nr:universal stress protein [Chloroflexota bacterium]
MFEKILVCLDGSKAAEQILTHIAGDAAKLRAELILLRVIRLPESIVPVNVPGQPGVLVRTEKSVGRIGTEEGEARNYLDSIAEPLRNSGLSTECVVLEGATGETIIKYAQENDCSLIAIGAHGHGGLRRLALGSTADYVLHHSPLPVLTVRPES